MPCVLMMDRTEKFGRRLTVIQGGGILQGPITRMGLWGRYSPVSTRWLIWILFCKLAVLVSLLYYITSL